MSDDREPLDTAAAKPLPPFRVRILDMLLFTIAVAFTLGMCRSNNPDFLQWPQSSHVLLFVSTTFAVLEGCLATWRHRRWPRFPGYFLALVWSADAVFPLMAMLVQTITGERTYFTAQSGYAAVTLCILAVVALRGRWLWRLFFAVSMLHQAWHRGLIRWINDWLFRVWGNEWTTARYPIETGIEWALLALLVAAIINDIARGRFEDWTHWAMVAVTLLQISTWIW